MNLETRGEVTCNICMEKYIWNDELESTEIFFTNGSTSVNNCIESFDAEVYSECPHCNRKNKHIIRIKVK